MTEEIIETYNHKDVCVSLHCKNCDKCLKNYKSYQLLECDYCAKCYEVIFKALDKNPVYVSKDLQHWIERLTDLFCLDHTPIVQIKPRKKHYGINGCDGVCHWTCTPIIIDVCADRKGRISLETLVHEFLHASGYAHKWGINDWANFGYGRGRDRDRFSRLIVRDLTGKDEFWI